VTVVNATGHEVRKRRSDGSIRSYLPSPLTIRLASVDLPDRSIPGEDVVQRRFFHEPLPVPNTGVVYIVSRKVAFAYAGIRNDFIYPDTESGAERDSNGRILSVRRFRRPDILMLHESHSE